MAYLKGLMDGLGIDDSTKEGKVLVNIVDVLDDIIDEITELHDSRAELDEYVQTIDEDLSNIEDELYGQNSLDEDGDYSGKAQYIEVECPHCHDIVYFTDDIFDIEDELLCLIVMRQYMMKKITTMQIRFTYLYVDIIYGPVNSTCLFLCKNSYKKVFIVIDIIYNKRKDESR